MSTTKTYKSWPAAAVGRTFTTSATAWANAAYIEVVAAAAITNQYDICALTAMYPTTATVDTTFEVEIELATGAAAAEVPIITVPFSYRVDTQAGHHPVLFLVFPEPKIVAANTRLAVRVRSSLAVATLWNGIKIFYLE
jgi:hypothetical protein